MTIPVEITHLDGMPTSRAVQTRDIGSGGMLLSVSREMTEGGILEYRATLIDATPPVRIRCRGVVVRVLKLEPEGGTSFEVAVTIDRYEFLRLKQSPVLSPAISLRSDIQ